MYFPFTVHTPVCLGLASRKGGEIKELYIFGRIQLDKSDCQRFLSLCLFTFMHANNWPAATESDPSGLRLLVP